MSSMPKLQEPSIVLNQKGLPGIGKIMQLAGTSERWASGESMVHDSNGTGHMLEKKAADVEGKVSR